jgi:macrolide transport system ATP-binding/permease protein
MKKSVIKIRNLSKIFKMGDQSLKALDDVSLDIYEGQFVAIVGPSGSGKSTLMHIIGLLDSPDQGTYDLGGTNIGSLNDVQLSKLRSKTIGFIFQQFNLLARTSASDNVALPMLYSGETSNNDWPIKLLGAVGLSDRCHHTPNQLSGGQQQRVAIARSLVNKPLIILADEPTGNLDSHSEKEILDLLVRLNKIGITIVIVTHDAEVTQIANRVIRMRDGHVVSDELQEPIFEGLSSHKAIPKEDISNIYEASSFNAAMISNRLKLTNHLREAFKSVVSNKIRSMLSILGVLIGVAAVIAMLGLGAGAKKSMESQLSSLGSNLLVVFVDSSRPSVSTSESSLRLNMDDLDDLKGGLDHVLALSGRVEARGTKSTVQYGEKTWNPTVTGASASYASMRASLPSKGRFFTESEDRARARVAVLGLTVVDKIFGDEDPIGQQIKINRVYFEVIGVLPEKGASTWRDQDDVVLIPLETAMKRTFGYDVLNSIDIQVDDPKNIPSVEKQIRDIMALRKRLDSDEAKEAIQVRNMSDIREAISSTSKIMSTLLAIVAGISLLVGGIGVMNIMLVSVTERTKEIGLRKALGATPKDIMTQFLVESTLLSVFGGSLGVGLGWGISEIAAIATGWSFLVSISSVVLVTSITMLVGVVFGFWPARKASLLQPIVALKHE